MLKFAIIIPARYASTRFRGKPLAMLGSRPLIQHVYSNALKANLPVYVATDNTEIADCVKGFGGRVIMTADTHRSGTDRLCEALGKLTSRPDVVINLQGDEPFVTVEQINALIECFSDPETQIATLVQRFDPSRGFDALFSPNLVKVTFDDNHHALYFSRSIIPYTRSMQWSEWLQTTDYFSHIGMYAYRADVLTHIAAMPQSSLEKAESLEQLRWLQAGYTIKIAEVESENIGIDTPEDLEEANRRLSLMSLTYPVDFENKIGFNVLRSMLSAKCITPLGQVHCDNMTMISDRSRLLPILLRVAEMKYIIECTDSFPLNSVSDPYPYIIHLKAEGSRLSAENFADLAAFMQTVQRLRAYFSPDSEETEHHPQLTKRFSDIPDLNEPLSLICNIVDRYGRVYDHASQSLADIRRQIDAAQVAVNGMMRRVIEVAVKQGFLSADISPSVRDGHLVIPVSAANKKQIPGIVYDQSATGKTFYIEPTQVVEANNSLKALQLEERKEIIEILTTLAAEIRPFVASMEDAANQVGAVDFIRAKALLAIELNAQMPTISHRVELDWYHAMHPVLLLSLRRQGREVVPLDIQMNQKNRIVVISGPNAGGKSVCLKTIAIVQYMMQCGLLPTLYSNSHMGVFSKLLIDIGDEQSIENDLSTYSSHLRNMRSFLTQAGKDTLFLADEMGSGTEPQIGGAIAQAILGKLNSKGAFGVVTTHYQNLKSFANETEGMVNAAMLYDRQHLQPLFRLSIGTPGSSFALDIARKSGISTDVIENAKSIAGSDYVNIDKYLLDLARDKKYWEEKRLAIKEKEHSIDRYAESLHMKAQEIKNRRAEILHQAKQEAKMLAEGVNAKIEKAIRDIRIAAAEKEQTKKVRKELESYLKHVSQQEITDNANTVLQIPHRRKKEPKIILPTSSVAKREFKEGDYVKIPSSSVPGKILSISGSKADIAIGGLHISQPLSVLVPASVPPKKNAHTISSSTYDDSRQRQLNFHNEIDVRGFRADEALQAVTYLLDDAVQFQASRVRILHGTGTGALRIAIRQLLQASDVVKSFHDEDVRLGGAGITVVNLL